MTQLPVSPDLNDIFAGNRLAPKAEGRGGPMGGRRTPKKAGLDGPAGEKRPRERGANGPIGKRLADGPNFLISFVF